MDILQLDVGQLLTFLLILTRVSGVFFLAPVLGSRNIPPQVKIGLSLMTSIALFPFVKSPDLATTISGFEYAMLLAKELSAGAIIGFTATMVFMGFLLAGQILDFQMGFGMVNVIDPLSNISISIMGQFKNLLAILVFLAINGHHYLLTALAKSFDLVPLTAFSFSPSLTNNFIDMVVDMFVIGLKIGGPAIGVLFITELALGIMARTVPQMNVFIVGIPLRIGIGLATVVVMLSFYFAYMLRVFDQMPNLLVNSIK